MSTATESPARWLARVARNCERINRAERLSIGTLKDTARRIRADLETLTQYQQPAYREDVAGILGELAYPLGTYRDCPAIWLQPCADSELAEQLMSLGADLQKHAPRKLSSIWASVRMDVRRYVIWFDLPAEEVDPLSLDGAAA